MGEREYETTYSIGVQTSMTAGGGTDEDVYIRFMFNDGSAIGDYHLNINGWNNFERGDADHYYIRNLKNEPAIYDCDSIYLYVEQNPNSNDSPMWFPTLISVVPLPYDKYISRERNRVRDFPINRLIGIPDRNPGGDPNAVNKVVIQLGGTLVSSGTDPHPDQTFPKLKVLNRRRDAGWYPDGYNE